MIVRRFENEEPRAYGRRIGQMGPKARPENPERWLRNEHFLAGLREGRRRSRQYETMREAHARRVREIITARPEMRKTRDHMRKMWSEKNLAGERLTMCERAAERSRDVRTARSREAVTEYARSRYGRLADEYLAISRCYEAAKERAIRRLLPVQ